MAVLQAPGSNKAQMQQATPDTSSPVAMVGHLPKESTASAPITVAGSSPV